MRWPWVSRALYDAKEADNALWQQSSTRWSMQCESLRGAVERGSERYDALLDKYHALKVSGATIPEPVRPVERKEPDALVQTINVLSAGKPGLRAMMMKQLAQDRANPLLDDADILQRIQSGMPMYEEGIPA